MISEIRGVGHELTDKKQVQVMIRSLPNAWEHFYNDNIKTFDDDVRHVKLEEDCLLANKPYEEAYMTESKKIGAFGLGQKKWKCKVIKQRKGKIKPTSTESNASSEDVRCILKPFAFIDDFTRYDHVYLISNKSEALECFIRYSILVEN